MSHPSVHQQTKARYIGETPYPCSEGYRHTLNSHKMGAFQPAMIIPMPILPLSGNIFKNPRTQYWNAQMARQCILLLLSQLSRKRTVWRGSRWEHIISTGWIADRRHLQKESLHLWPGDAIPQHYGSKWKFCWWFCHSDGRNDTKETMPSMKHQC